jgi:LytR cell envelope-related transcriptional attenuator
MEFVRPWRTATLVAASVAVLELVLLVIAGFVLLSRTVAPQVHAAAVQAAVAPARTPAATRASAKAKPAAPARPLLPRAKTGVLILNGNGVQGAAAQAATVVRARGYLVTDTKNAPRTGYATWHLMAAPGYAHEAMRFARDIDLASARVGPLDGMTPKQLHGAKLVLILGISR